VLVPAVLTYDAAGAASNGQRHDGETGLRISKIMVVILCYLGAARPEALLRRLLQANVDPSKLKLDGHGA
jgi:hypothetical protein